MGLYGADGTLYLLGLCEGNYCQQETEKGFDKGHGVIIVFRKIKDKVRLAAAPYRSRDTPLKCIALRSASPTHLFNQA
jgi:hypothetical protein